MIKICFITTISSTLKAFILKTAEYIHNNTDWDISFICDKDDEFEKNLPEYIHYIPIKMRRGISVEGIFAMLQMRRVFKREKFDIIQYSTPNASLYASIAGKLARIPVRLYCQWGMVFVGFSGIKRQIFKMEEKLVCSLSTWIEPDSYSNLNFAQNQGLYSSLKSSVIGKGSACGVDMNKFDIDKKVEFRREIRNKYNISSNAYVYGFVGRITRDKGVNELLESFKKIRNENDYLIMVGSDERDSSINEELFLWSKNCKNIIYTGFTTEVEKYLSAMDSYILPSYREGFGMGVIEAEAMGVPVIVTDIPGPIDAMQNRKTGYVVKKANIESLCNGMVKIRNEKDSDMGKVGVEFVRLNFEQNNILKNILEDRIRLINMIN